MYRTELANFFHEKFLKIASIASAVAASFIFLSFVTYNSADPSFNNATDKFPSNLMGYSGSHMADLLNQFFGMSAAPVLTILLFMWAYRFYSGRFITKIWLRAIAAFITISASAAIFSSVAEAGGVVGGFLESQLYLELTAPIYHTVFV